MKWLHFLLLITIILAIGNSGLISQAQGTRPATATKPFIMPVAGLSGPSTWLVGQPYGNTTGAFVNGASSYSRGQFLHFGVDISMPCGTPLVAVADAVVHSVDNPNRGSAPHNLLLQMPELGTTVLYGHLLERPALTAGQEVKQGEFVALSGEPESDCNGRTHLHLEVRSFNQTIAYNPIHFIDAPWHSLAALGAQSRPIFQRDLMNARRWMSLEDQPDVQFGGNRLNNYTLTYPSIFNRRLTSNTLPDRPLLPISPTWNVRQIGANGCCAGAWWHPTNERLFYFIDGVEGQVASIYEAASDGSQAPRVVQPAPPTATSPDGTYEIIYERQRTSFRRLMDSTTWTLEMPDVFPVLSPDNQFMMWTQGESYREIWVAALDGSLTQAVWRSQGRNAAARWLDPDHLLISEREPIPERYTTYYRVNIHDGTSQLLGTWHNPRNLQVAPGGKHLIFYSTFNPEPANDGAFVLDTVTGAAQKLPWFGDYRWRDAESVFYITFNPATDIQQLHYYHVPSGDTYPLTQMETTPFTIANADWSVSADGNAILFQEARDGNLWVLEAID